MAVALTFPTMAKGETKMSIWGHTADGTAVPIYTLTDGQIEVRVTAYGAHLVSVKAPDRSGKMADVVLGYDSLEGYLNDTKTYLGAIVGRYGNRIAGGKFTLDGKTYQIPLNNGPNALHGGPKGFDQYVWKSHEVPGRSRVHAREPRRRHGISRNADLDGALHAQGRYAAHRLHSHHRQGDRGEPDQPCVFQPAWRRQGQHSRPADGDQRRPVHAGGCRR